VSIGVSPVAIGAVLLGHALYVSSGHRRRPAIVLVLLGTVVGAITADRGTFQIGYAIVGVTTGIVWLRRERCHEHTAP
jgi:hypothetical protein